MALKGKVYLLGAGPGDPELITLRARRRLEQADVVLYDALVHADILSVCRTDAELVFVGKRAGKPSERQEAIHARMLAAVQSGKTVARLKGGDPFLFGRGSEEAEFLSDHDVPFEVVPGVSSPAAATAFAGLSLTHRDLASSVAFVTATESPEKDRSSHDWSRLATATQTLVIFMGLRRLRELMKLLKDNGRPGATPVAVVQWASMPLQRTVVGTVDSIADEVARAGLGMPALTVVGEVVNLRAKLRWWDECPLFGRRVVVTRAKEQSSGLVTLLRDVGAQPIELPMIHIVAPSDPSALDAATAQASSFDVVVFTSANGVERFFEAAFAGGRDTRCLGDATIATVGAKTAERLRAYGIVPDIVPTESNATATAEAILAHLGDSSGRRVLFPRSRIGREELPHRLRAAGVDVSEVVAYDSLPPSEAESSRIRAAFQDGVDAVLFTSSSSVENLIQVLGSEAPSLLKGVALGSIGPTTTATATRLGLSIAFHAPVPRVEALVSALEHHLHQGTV